VSPRAGPQGIVGGSAHAATMLTGEKAADLLVATL
jgi:hypothetical protein